MQHTNNATLINLTPTPSSKAKIKIKLTDTLIAKIKPPKRVARGTKKVLFFTYAPTGSKKL